MIKIDCEHSFEMHHGTPIHTIAFTIGAIIHDGIVITGFPGAKLVGCKSIKIAQGIAAHVIEDTFTAVLHKLQTAPEICATHISMQTITNTTDENDIKRISQSTDIHGEIEVSTEVSGKINIGVPEFEIPDDQMDQTPDTILIAYALRNLESATVALFRESDMLKRNLDGKQLDIRKIAVNTRLPGSVMERAR